MTEKCPFDKSKMQLAQLKLKSGEITYHSKGYRCPECGYSYFTGAQSKIAYQKYLVLKKFEEYL